MGMSARLRQWRVQYIVKTPSVIQSNAFHVDVQEIEVDAPSLWVAAFNAVRRVRCDSRNLILIEEVTK